MSTTEAATTEVAHRTIELPAIGTFIPRLQATFWHIQRAKPGGHADYALLVPHGDDFEFTGPWGSYGVDEPGAACMWNGLANTHALIECGREHPAAAFCAGKFSEPSAEGASPFYLPSLRELKALFANGCDAFSPDNWYWSSTQFSRNYAFFQHFGNGFTDGIDKAWEGGRARPVRRSSLESLIS